MYRTRASYKIVSLINLNKFLHYDTSDTEENISADNGSEELVDPSESVIVLRLPVSTLTL
jgi:hypothetical protein